MFAEKLLQLCFAPLSRSKLSISLYRAIFPYQLKNVEESLDHVIEAYRLKDTSTIGNLAVKEMKQMPNQCV